MATRSPRAIEKVMSRRMVREPFNREKPITSMAGSLMKGLRVDGPGHFFEEVDHPRAGDDGVALLHDVDSGAHPRERLPLRAHLLDRKTALLEFRMQVDDHVRLGRKQSLRRDRGEGDLSLEGIHSAGQNDELVIEAA